MSDIQYLIANHCFVFAATFSNALLYYARIDLICERMLLLKSLLGLLSSSLLSDNLQQTLNFIRHLLSKL